MRVQRASDPNIRHTRAIRATHGAGSNKTGARAAS